MIAKTAKRGLVLLGALLALLIVLTPDLRAQNTTTQCIVNVAAQGTSDAITSAQLPCGTTTTMVILTAAAANTTTTPTYAPIGSPPLVIIRPNGTALTVGDITGPGFVALLTGTGNNWILMNPGSQTIAGAPVGGVLTGTLPNPGMAAGAAAANIGTTRGVYASAFVGANGCQGNDAVDDSVGINAAITYVNSVGGGIVWFTQGMDCRLQNPILLQALVQLRGQGPVVNVAPGVGSVIRAAANLDAMVTQADLTTYIHSAGIWDLTFDGRKGTYTVNSIIKTYWVNGQLRQNYIGNGSNDCVHNYGGVVSGAPVDWINWYTDNTIYACNNYGMWNTSTDSMITNNYMTGAGVADLYIDSYGALKILGNQLEVATTGAGVIFAGNGAGCIVPEQTITFTGNNIEQNNVGIDIETGACFTSTYAAITMTGNIFIANVTDDIRIANGAINGNIVGNNFTTSNPSAGQIDFKNKFSSGNFAVTFSNGSANIGITNAPLLQVNQVVTFGTTGVLPTPLNTTTSYYVIATGLTQTNIQISATPGGSAIVMGSAGSGTQQLNTSGNSGWSICGNNYNPSNISTATAVINLPDDAQVCDRYAQFFGNGTVLGQTNTVAKFGLSANQTGDAWAGIGVASGVVPTFGCYSGAVAAATGCKFIYQATVGGGTITPWQVNSTNWFQVPTMQIVPVSIAALGPCNGSYAGQIKYVSDSTASGAATFHGAVTGGGGTTVTSLVSCTGAGGFWQYE